jgi:hypothetical protein
VQNAKCKMQNANGACVDAAGMKIAALSPGGAEQRTI